VTLYVTRSIHCESDGCFSDDFDGFPGQSAATVRDSARQSGWTRTRLVPKGPLVDLCPGCASRRAVALARRLVDGTS